MLDESQIKKITLIQMVVYVFVYGEVLFDDLPTKTCIIDFTIV